jgi:hypothetical protein
MAERSAAAEAAFEVQNPRLPTSSQIHTGASRVAALLPPRDLAPVAPSLRAPFAALPPEQTAGLDLLQFRPAEIFADLPPSEAIDAMVDTVGHTMLEVTREFAGRVETIERDADLFTAEGLHVAHRELAAQHNAALDQAVGGLVAELGRMDVEAAAAITRHQAASFQIDPAVELAARARWADALGGGSATVAALFDGVMAAGDQPAALALARIAEGQVGIALAQPAGDGAGFSRAMAVKPLVDALVARLQPAEVARAGQVRTAAAAGIERLRVFRAALGA